MKRPPLLPLNTHQHFSDTHVHAHMNPHVLSLSYLSVKVSDSQNPKDLGCMASRRGSAVSKIN